MMNIKTAEVADKSNWSMLNIWEAFTCIGNKQLITCRVYSCIQSHNAWAFELTVSVNVFHKANKYMLELEEEYRRRKSDAQKMLKHMKSLEQQVHHIKEQNLQNNQVLVYLAKEKCLSYCLCNIS